MTERGTSSTAAAVVVQRWYEDEDDTEIEDLITLRLSTEPTEEDLGDGPRWERKLGEYLDQQSASAGRYTLIYQHPATDGCAGDGAILAMLDWPEDQAVARS